jgi:transcription elongation factor Elf1
MKNYESKKKPYQHKDKKESIRSMTKKYTLVKTELAELNRFNCYVCSSCNYITKTVDVHKGTTPMFLGCNSCGKQAISTWYKDIAPEQKPELEWYTPTLKEFIKLRNNPGMVDHILMGGLELRKVK